MRLPEYESHDALGLADLVRRKEVTATELVEAAIERIERWNRRLNAVIQPMFDEARAVAARPLPGGPFAGVPFLLKDFMAACAGVPLGSGSRFCRDVRPDHHSELVRRFLAAGVIVLGKTNTPELGLMPVTEPAAWGPTRNPRGWGAHAGGLVGRLGGRGRRPHGPDGQRGRWRRLHPDPGLLLWSVRLQAEPGAHAERPRRPRPLARPHHRARAHPERARQRRHARCHARSGRRRLSPGAAGGAAVPRRGRRGSRTPAHRLERRPVHPVTARRPGARGGAGRGGAPPRRSRSRARRGATPAGRARLRPRVPLQPSPAERVAQRILARLGLGRLALSLGVLDTAARTIFDFMPFTPIFNATGQPSMSVPLYWTAGGLPIGVMLTGRHGDDGTLFRLAGQLERARPWRDRRPPALS